MNKCKVLLHVVLLLFLSQLSLAQLKLRLNVEGGYYSTTTSFTNTDNNLEARLDGKLSYNIKSRKRNTTLGVRVRPEVFGVNNSLTSIKLQGTGSHRYLDENQMWNFNLAANSSNYNYSSSSTTISTFSLNVNYNYLLNKESDISLSVGYTFRSASENTSLDMDILFASSTFAYIVLPNFTIGAGVYLERYSSEFDTDDLYIQRKLTNNGYRFGPEFILNFSSKWIFRANYNLVFHASEVTNDISFEHVIKAVAGKALNRITTIMILAEYYYEDLDFKDISSYDRYLYFPSNIENEIYAKISFDISDRSEFYLRSGYFNINLQLDNSTLSGWNILAGYQLKM
jgi:hypothetical protein